MTGKQVRTVRRRLGLTQVQLAERVGIHPLTVSRWECDRVRVTAPMERLLRLLLTTQGGRR